ncbi:hypothetical protein AB4539_00645 [Vibrio splendidus]
MPIKKAQPKPHSVNSLFPTLELLIQYLQARFVSFNGCLLDTYQATPTQVKPDDILDLMNQSGHYGIKKATVASLKLKELVIDEA